MEGSVMMKHFDEKLQFLDNAVDSEITDVQAQLNRLVKEA